GKGSIVSIETWDDTEWVYLQIKDTGIGIPEEDLEHIFDKFYRVRNDASHLIKGTGLGLYLVKYFVELHEGEIVASSFLGKGTTFTIKLKNS
nr:ATP-binding protein [Bacteriovoracaceae bacterium]